MPVLQNSLPEITITVAAGSSVTVASGGTTYSVVGPAEIVITLNQAAGAA